MSVLQKNLDSVLTNLVSRHVFSTSRMTKEKGHHTDETTPVRGNTPFIHISGQRRVEDYAAYKGRGRYGKDMQPRMIFSPTTDVSVLLVLVSP